MMQLRTCGKIAMTCLYNSENSWQTGAQYTGKLGLEASPRMFSESYLYGFYGIHAINHWEAFKFCRNNRYQEYYGIVNLIPFFGFKMGKWSFIFYRMQPSRLAFIWELNIFLLRRSGHIESTDSSNDWILQTCWLDFLNLKGGWESYNSNLGIRIWVIWLNPCFFAV